MKFISFSCLIAVFSVGSFAAHAVTSISSQCAIVPAVPSPQAGVKALSPAGGSDATVAIQAALDGLNPGDWLLFRPGTYTISRHLVVRVPSVTLYGNGATIHATNPIDGAVMIKSDNVAVYGFTFTQHVTTRQSTPWAGGISVYGGGGAAGPKRVFGSIIQNNTFNNTAGGIMIYKVSNFTVANNHVSRTLADGIHMTAGSLNGRVIHNTVSQTGDDMIAVVSYAGDRSAQTLAQRYRNWAKQQDELDQNIYIADNDVSDQYWGRGIAVAGGTHITIEGNTISKTAIGAGIYLTRETSYLTFGDHNVLVDNNVISHVQTDPPTYKPAGFNGAQTHQAAIEIAAQMSSDEASNSVFRTAFSTTDIAIIGNQIQDARFSGIRAGIYSPDQSVGRVTISGNTIQKIAQWDPASSEVVQTFAGVTTATMTCTGNTLEGVAWGTRCDKSGGAPVTAKFPVSGSQLQCDANGHIIALAAATPLPPDNLLVN